MRPHTAVLHRPCGLVHSPVHIIECRSTGLYHLQTGQAGRPIDKLVIQNSLRLPYSIQPSGKRHILADSPEKSHSGMGMHIDKGRHHCFSASVQDGIRVHGQPMTDTADNPLLYIYVVSKATFPYLIFSRTYKNNKNCQKSLNFFSICIPHATESLKIIILFQSVIKY